MKTRGIEFTDFQDWCAIDAAELAEGERCGRPRVKCDSRDSMWGIVRRADGRAVG
jgi:hypothetical protein